MSLCLPQMVRLSGIIIHRVHMKRSWRKINEYMFTVGAKGSQLVREIWHLRRILAFEKKKLIAAFDAKEREELSKAGPRVLKEESA